MAVNKPYMRRINLVGYSDRPSVCGSEKIKYTASSEFETYKANLVQLIHGEINPAGHDFKEIENNPPKIRHNKVIAKTRMFARMSKLHIPKSFILFSHLQCKHGLGQRSHYQNQTRELFRRGQWMAQSALSAWILMETHLLGLARALFPSESRLITYCEMEYSI